jgi:hypothetical protein
VAGPANDPKLIRFTGQVRQWDPGKPGGLAVVDVPESLVSRLGGRRQMRVTGTLNGKAYSGSSMLVAGGGLCIGTSKAALKAAGATIGDTVAVEIAPAKT